MTIFAIFTGFLNNEYAWRGNVNEVKDAIILAGGMGTRMLPASLLVPKETLPLIDTPGINHLIWEAAKAGISRIHLVLSKRKEEHLKQFITEGGVYANTVRKDLPREALAIGVEGIEIFTHVQKNPGGVADAISVALTDVEGPFLVLLGDMIIIETHLSPKFSGPENASSSSRSLVDKFEQSGLPCVGVIPVDGDQISNYGVVEITEGMVSSIVEKPSPEEAPSRYILCGRYLLPQNTARILKDFPVSEYGELQSIQLLRHLIESSGLNAVKLDEMQMYDSGDPLSWLKSQIDHGLRRKDISQELYEWIFERVSE